MKMRYLPMCFLSVMALVSCGGDDEPRGGDAAAGAPNGGGGTGGGGGNGGSSTAGQGGDGGAVGGASGNGGATGGYGGDGGPGAGGDAAADAGDSGGKEGDGGQPGTNCPMPAGGVLAVFEVVGEQYFRANIIDTAAIQQAIDLWRGDSAANIPNGKLICEAAPYNCGYNWHLDPEDIHFAEITIELCDGTPSYIEENCDTFGDRYCTWAAELVELRDCRQQGCPLVSR